MKNLEHFENFLESLKGRDQDILVESLVKALHACFESEERSTQYTIQFSECEHHGDLDTYTDDLKASGAKIMSTEVDEDELDL